MISDEFQVTYPLVCSKSSGLKKSRPFSDGIGTILLLGQAAIGIGSLKKAKSQNRFATVLRIFFVLLGLFIKMNDL